MLKKLLNYILISDETPSSKSSDKAETQKSPLAELTQNAWESFQNCTDIAQKIAFLSQLQSKKATRQIIREITQLDTLRAIMNSTTLNEEAKEEAEKRFNQLSQDQKKDSGTRALQRLENTLSEIEKILDSDQWYTAFDRYNKLIEDWDTFEDVARAAEGYDALNQRYQQLHEGFKTKIKQQEKNNESRTDWDAVCQRIDVLAQELHTLSLPQIETQFVELRETYENLPSLPESIKNIYEKRFNASMERIKNYIAKHEELQEKQKDLIADAQKVIDKINAINAQESLPNPNELKSISSDFENLIKPLKGIDGSLRAEFNEAMNIANAKLHEAENIEKEKQAARTQGLEALVNELKEIVATEITSENIKNQIDDFNTKIEAIQALHPSKKDSIYTVYKKLENEFINQKRTFFATINEERWANYSRKIKVAEKAEDYLKWCGQESIFAEILGFHKALWEEWKAIGPTPMEVKDEIWNRFNEAMQGISKWLDEKRGAEDIKRQENLSAKQGICDAISQLVDAGFSNVKGAQKQFNELFETWKNTGPVPASERETINERFKNLIELFNVQRNTHFDNIRGQFEKAQALKNRLIDEAKALENLAWREGSQLIQNLRSEWKTAGYAGKQEESLWTAFNGLIQAFYQRASASETENLAIKEKVCSVIENCAKNLQEANLKTMDSEVHEAFETWKSTGPVPTDKMDALMTRFKSAVDAWHTQRDEISAQLNNVREANQQIKESIVAEVETVLNSDESQKEIAEKLKALQQKFRAVGHSFHACDEALNKQLNELCNAFFENRKASFDAAMSERRANLERKREICMKLERLAQMSPHQKNHDNNEELTLSIDSIAKELEFLLSFNTLAESPKSREEIVNEAKVLQAQWYEIGAVPKEDFQALQARYRKACDSIFGVRKPKKQEEPSSTAPAKEEAPIVDIKPNQTKNDNNPIVS